MVIKMVEWEDYLINGTNVLKNKKNINSSDELKRIENETVIARLSYLYINGMDGKFDVEHLCKLHYFLFGEIYDFAGKYREVDVYKVTDFEHFENIDSELKKLFSRMNKIDVNTNNKFEIAKYLGEFYLELIRIHPFREGNGRTCREFIRQMVLSKFPMYELDYTKIDKNNFYLGVVERKTYPLLIAFEINNALIPVEKNKNMQK